jgi:crotonobetainyl-CoA:carnitine CoA-transferase CaiB-like acyl-CoA transferase
MLGLHALYRLYEAGDGWVFLAATGDRDFQRLCAALGLRGLAKDPRFIDRASRAAHDDALARELGRVFSGKSAAGWEAELAGRGVACVEVHGGPHAAYIFDAPWAEQLGFVETTAASGAGPYRRYGRAVRSAHDFGPTSGADLPGAATRTVLAGVGYDDETIDKLLAMGVIAEPTRSESAG